MSEASTVPAQADAVLAILQLSIKALEEASAFMTRKYGVPSEQQAAIVGLRELVAHFSVQGISESPPAGSGAMSSAKRGIVAYAVGPEEVRAPMCA